MRRISIFRYLIAVLLVISCASSKPAPVPESPTANDLPLLSSITTVENAKRALIIAQDLRVTYRNHVAAKVTFDGKIDDAEWVALRRFDEYDKKFTSAWAAADLAVGIWDRTGSRPQTFDDPWHTIETLIIPPIGLRDPFRPQPPF